MGNKYFLPDRFEAIKDKTKEIPCFILGVNKSIGKINELIDIINTSGRGTFLLVRGKSGSGKTTFLNTINQFSNEKFEILSVGEDVKIQDNLKTLKSTNHFRIVIIEDRENIEDLSSIDVVSKLQSINKFIRSKKGLNTIVVWPFNEYGNLDDFIYTAQSIGGTSLIDEYENYHEFDGPSKKDYYEILINTFEYYNPKKTLEDFGITETVALKLIKESYSIGDLITNVNTTIRRNKKELKNYFSRIDKFSMWIIVIAKNDPYKDIGVITKGKHGKVDINRIFENTDSNISKKFSNNPKFQLFANAIDCRILYLSSKSALEFICCNDDGKLAVEKNKAEVNYTSFKVDALDRIKKETLYKYFHREKTSRTNYKKMSDKNKAEFSKLLKIAESNDEVLNKQIASLLSEALNFPNYDTEVCFNDITNRRADVVFFEYDYSYRLEFMWRSYAGIAEISKYTLEKIYNYGEMVGYFKQY